MSETTEEMTEKSRTESDHNNIILKLRHLKNEIHENLEQGQIYGAQQDFRS